jgi:uncharacterized membrane protein
MPSSPGPAGNSLPSPEDLKKYDAASPGLGRKIIEMVQEEQRHLQAMDHAEISLSRRGQLFGFIIAISFLVVSGFLINQGHTVAGTVIGSVDLVALTTVFVVGQRSQGSAPEIEQSESIDRIIRELRRSRSRKSRKKLPVVESRRATGDSAKSSTQVAEEKPTAPSNPTNVTSTSGVPGPSPALEPAAPSSPSVGDSGDIEKSIPKQRPHLTEEDIEIYRKIYEGSPMNSDDSESPQL